QERGGREHGQGAGHGHVGLEEQGAMLVAVMGICHVSVLLAIGSAPGPGQTRYSSGNRKIHTISTKCQYRPVYSSMATCCGPNPPVRPMIRMITKITTPPRTCRAWKPVMAK